MDLVVIGRGPAGLQAAIYAVRAGLHVTVVGRDPGALKTAEKIENYFGFEKAISGMALVEAGTKQAARLGVEIIDAEVTAAGWADNLYVRFGDTVLDTTAIIVATGMPRKKPAISGIEAFEGNGVSYCAVCDAFFFKSKTCAVIGDGLYAIQEARELMPFAGTIHLLSNGRPFNFDIPDTIKLTTKKITKITADADGRVAGVCFSDNTTLSLDGIFVAEGTASALDFAIKLGLETEGNAIKIQPDGSTNLPGVFACGDCTGGLLQIAKAVGQGAEAGMSAAAYVKELRGEKHTGVQW